MRFYCRCRLSLCKKKKEKRRLDHRVDLVEYLQLTMVSVPGSEYVTSGREHQGVIPPRSNVRERLRDQVFDQLG